MKEVLEGALGIKETWLMDFAERAELCNINHDTLVKTIEEN
jgi:hypothetical protein